VGILVYYLISSTFPYEEWIEGQKMFVESPIQQVVESGPEADFFSPQLQDFLVRCLASDSPMRWNARELLGHSWIKEKMAARTKH